MIQFTTEQLENMLRNKGIDPDSLPDKLHENMLDAVLSAGGSGGESDFILELSEDGKNVLTPISEYCAAFREGKTVKLNGCYSSWGVRYNMVMQYYSGNPGFEQDAVFSAIYYADAPNLFYAIVSSDGTITCSKKNLTAAT